MNNVHVERVGLGQDRSVDIQVEFKLFQILSQILSQKILYYKKKLIYEAIEEYLATSLGVDVVAKIDTMRFTDCDDGK